MAEFALVLPLLVLLLVFAVDLGRVFFGWVSVTNAARIGASYASQYPRSWDSPGGDAARQTEYRTNIEQNVAGCTLDPVQAPQFIDRDGVAPNNGVGDHARVTLTCRFSLLTPIASGIVGNNLTIGAQSEFPVRMGTFAGPSTGPGGGGNEPCVGLRIPDLRNMTVAQARDFWTNTSGFTGSFTASPNTDEFLVQTQQFTPSANVNDCVGPETTVFVTAVAPPPCPSGQAQVPNMIGQTVAAARDSWDVDFERNNFSVSPPAAASTVDAKVVLTQQTSPTQVLPNACLSTSGSVTVTYGDPPPPMCDVPNMVGRTGTQADGDWTGAGFTRSLVIQGHTSGTVKTQDPGHPGRVRCDVQGKVDT